MTALGAATDFLTTHGRLLERRRLALAFGDGGAGPVVDALAAYANPDGGFGHGLEPDLRGPSSQPAGAQTALEVLHEAGAREHALVDGAVTWLLRHRRDDGGLPFLLPTDEPRAPWWQAADASSLTQSGANAAALHALGRGDEALDAYCWDRIGARAFEGPYDVRFALAFLDAVPDDARAGAALDGLGPHVLVGEDPAHPGEAHRALDYAPRPGTRSRGLFDPAAIDAGLDALEAAQHEDGGWDFDWPRWSPMATLEWRGVVTLAALETLRANGRL